MLYWPRPHGLYLAPFPDECRGTPNIRVQPVSFSILSTEYPSYVVPLLPPYKMILSHFGMTYHSQQYNELPTECQGPLRKHGITNISYAIWSYKVKFLRGYHLDLYTLSVVFKVNR